MFRSCLAVTSLCLSFGLLIGGMLLVAGCEEKQPVRPVAPVTSGWRAGPMPSGTWNWGGVVPAGEDLGGGFYFADFHGDYVQLVPNGKRIDAKDIAYYNNSLDLPPSKTGSKFGSRADQAGTRHD